MQKSEQCAIFNLFHDGTFLSLQRETHDIRFQIEIQYLAEMVDPTYSSFTGVFKNCQQFCLQLWEDEKKWYEDSGLISSFLKNMEIARASSDHTQVLVSCLSETREQVGGSLIFSCERIILFDEGQREITFHELKERAHRYWTLDNR